MNPQFNEFFSWFIELLLLLMLLLSLSESRSLKEEEAMNWEDKKE